jgi:hypothetical protein
VHYLCQLVHNYPKVTISIPSPRQSHDKIHSYLYPLPLGYLQGLQDLSGSLMLRLDSLIGVSNSNILSNISLHSILPIGCIEVLVHLIPSWTNGISGIVSLLKYLILQFLNVRHTDPSFVRPYSLIIFLKFG